MALRIALVVPHMFMQADILPHVIFSPGHLSIALADSLVRAGHPVTLFSPGHVDTLAQGITADLHLFEQELYRRGDSYLDLLRKHPLTFITLARQVQSEIVARAYQMANEGLFDVVHIYTNEEDIALPFASLCKKPVVFTHHDPFNFLARHKSIFPKYKHLNWISISHAQRTGMPLDTHWVGNVYHGVDGVKFAPVKNPSEDYFAYFGRIIPQKGVHLAMAAVSQYNLTAPQPIKLKIAGKHYADHDKDTYWREIIEPKLDDTIQYAGFFDDDEAKRQFLGNARALLVPSLFEEPFGMVAIEALACGTPVVALDSGALSEIIETGSTGYVVKKVFAGGQLDEASTAAKISRRLHSLASIDRHDCRMSYEQRFTTDRMCQEYTAIYNSLSG